MDDLEQKLRKVLEQKPPSDDFGGRVSARLMKESHEADRRALQRRWYFRWATACVLIATTTGVFAFYHRQREREQGEAAKQQVLVALRITSEKLQIAQHRVRQISDHRGEI